MVSMIPKNMVGPICHRIGKIQISSRVIPNTNRASTLFICYEKNLKHKHIMCSFQV